VCDIILQILHLLVISCSKSMQNDLHEILQIAVKNLSYDPGFIGSNLRTSLKTSGPEESMNVNGEEEDEFDFGGEGFSSGSEEDGGLGEEEEELVGIDEVDDGTWRLRKRCAKLLSAIVTSNSDYLKYFHSHLISPLLRQFTDRVETVQLEAMSAFDSLSDMTRDALESLKAEGEISDVTLDQLGQSLGETSINILVGKVRNVTESVIRKLFETLSRFVLIRVNGFPPSTLERITHKTIDVVSGGGLLHSTVVRTDAVILLHEIIRTHSPLLYDSLISEMIEKLTALLGVDTPHQLTIGAFRCLSSLFSHLLEPKHTELRKLAQAGAVKAAPLSLERLESNTADQDIREKAIDLLGLLTSNYGREFSHKTLISLVRFIDNEPTRMSALHAISLIALHEVELLQSFVGVLVPKLADFLRHKSRALQLSALRLLNTLSRSAFDVHSTQIEGLLHVLCVFFQHGDDPTFCTLVLEILTHFVNNIESVRAIVCKTMYTDAFQLLEQRVLLPATLTALSEFFVCLVRHSVKSEEQLLSDFYHYAQVHHTSDSQMGETNLRLSSSVDSSIFSLSHSSKCVAKLVVCSPRMSAHVAEFIQQV
jgi:hypothetical protein